MHLSQALFGTLLHDPGRWGLILTYNLLYYRLGGVVLAAGGLIILASLDLASTDLASTDLASTALASTAFGGGAAAGVGSASTARALTEAFTGLVDDMITRAG